MQHHLSKQTCQWKVVKMSSSSLNSLGPSYSMLYFLMLMAKWSPCYFLLEAHLHKNNLLKFYFPCTSVAKSNMALQSIRNSICHKTECQKWLALCINLVLIMMNKHIFKHDIHIWGQFITWGHADVSNALVLPAGCLWLMVKGKVAL